MKSYRNAISVRRQFVADQIKLTFTAVALAFLAPAFAARAESAPELPSLVCDKVNVGDTNKVSSHAYALGVQVYRWSGTNWVFIAPEATLYSEQCYENRIGIHYAGPTWEANDGSVVQAARLDGCTPYRGAIPWLRLGAISNSGNGNFGRVTFIQRVNTIGGIAPAEAGTFIGDEARVPYTAEYYFYRTTKQ